MEQKTETMGVIKITHHYPTINDIRYHSAEAGEGPQIVLQHGFPELWYSWRHQ